MKRRQPKPANFSGVKLAQEENNRHRRISKKEEEEVAVGESAKAEVLDPRQINRWRHQILTRKLHLEHRGELPLTLINVCQASEPGCLSQCWFIQHQPQILI